jgi:hypothetical protein
VGRVVALQHGTPGPGLLDWANVEKPNFGKGWDAQEMKQELCCLALLSLVSRQRLQLEETEIRPSCFCRSKGPESSCGLIAARCFSGPFGGKRDTPLRLID